MNVSDKAVHSKCDVGMNSASTREDSLGEYPSGRLIHQQMALCVVLRLL